MAKFFYLLSFLASVDPTYKSAGDTSRMALLETREMKEDLKIFEDNAEKELYRYTGLHQEDAIYVFYMYPLVAGKLSTKPFKGLKYETFGFTFRPELEYEYRTNQHSELLILIKEF